FHPAKYKTGTPFSLYTGIWYEITSSAAGTALRMMLRTRLSIGRTSLGFEAMYSFTNLKSVLAIVIICRGGLWPPPDEICNSLYVFMRPLRKCRDVSNIIDEP